MRPSLGQLGVLCSQSLSQIAFCDINKLSSIRWIAKVPCNRPSTSAWVQQKLQKKSSRIEVSVNNLSSASIRITRREENVLNWVSCWSQKWMANSLQRNANKNSIYHIPDWIMWLFFIPLIQLTSPLKRCYNISICYWTFFLSFLYLFVFSIFRRCWKILIIAGNSRNKEC